VRTVLRAAPPAPFEGEGLYGEVVEVPTAVVKYHRGEIVRFCPFFAVMFQ
jgi:hypothetical protein